MPLKKQKIKLKNTLKKKPINSAHFATVVLLANKEATVAKRHSDYLI